MKKEAVKTVAVEKTPEPETPKAETPKMETPELETPEPETPEAEQDFPVLVGKVFNGTIQVFGAPLPNIEAAKQVLKSRKNDGVFVALPVIEL